MMFSGHVFNWEWFNFWQQLFLKKNASYLQKMQNPFGKKKKKIRSRYGNEALEAG